MGEICIGDVRSLFKSNYVGRLTRSQVVAFQIADTGGPPRARDVVRVPANLHTELNSSIRRPFLARKIRRRGGERREGERKGTELFLSSALTVDRLENY